jgi:hypothetical protein
MITNMDSEKQQDSVEHVEVHTDSVEHKKLLRKIDLFLMPAIWVIYLFSYVVCFQPVSVISPI